MKKYILFLITIILIISTNVYAYSSSFSTIIENMGVETISKNGYSLNEEIYNQYKQFVYGSPLNISAGQRWKNVSNGLWTQNGGAWKGSGVRGEYWVLGYNVIGNEVHNQKFPVDIEPPTPPTKWRYVHLEDAEESWNNIEKYLFEEQKEYMKTTKLYRNDVEYDITALDIGLDKARAENFPTWKTNGSIYTRRYDMNNKEWAANFIVPPIAGNADIQGYINLINGEEYTISKDDVSIDIPINIGAEVINLTEFAKKDHVNRIKLELYINDTLIDSKGTEKTLSISKNSKVTINKGDYSSSDVELEIKLVSTLVTEFAADGALVDIKTKNIKIHIEGIKENNHNNVRYEFDAKFKEFPPPEIINTYLSRVVDNSSVLLPISKRNNSRFICAGQILQIEVTVANNPDMVTLEFEGDKSIMTLDELTKKFEWDEPRERGVKTNYLSLNDLKSKYKMARSLDLISEDEETGTKKYMIKYLIPYGTKQTIHSWSTLREISKDAFEIDESKLFSRIMPSYKIVLKAYGVTGKTTSSYALDVFERWDTLYNRDLTPYIK